MSCTDAFAKRLVKLRKERGITQQQFADKIGISVAALSYYETGKRTINIELLGKIANFFNVTSDYLLGLSDVRTVNKDMQTACKVAVLSKKRVKKIESALEEMQYFLSKLEKEFKEL